MEKNIIIKFNYVENIYLFILLPIPFTYYTMVNTVVIKQWLLILLNKSWIFYNFYLDNHLKKNLRIFQQIIMYVYNTNSMFLS